MPGRKAHGERGPIATFSVLGQILATAVIPGRNVPGNVGFPPVQGRSERSVQSPVFPGKHRPRENNPGSKGPIVAFFVSDV